MSLPFLTAMRCNPKIMVEGIARRRCVIPANFRVLHLPTAHQQRYRAFRVLAPQPELDRASAHLENPAVPRGWVLTRKGARNHLAQQVSGTFFIASPKTAFDPVNQAVFESQTVAPTGPLTPTLTPREITWIVHRLTQVEPQAARVTGASEPQNIPPGMSNLHVAETRLIVHRPLPKRCLLLLPQSALLG